MALGRAKLCSRLLGDSHQQRRDVALMDANSSNVCLPGDVSLAHAEPVLRAQHSRGLGAACTGSRAAPAPTWCTGPRVQLRAGTLYLRMQRKPLGSRPERSQSREGSKGAWELPRRCWFNIAVVNTVVRRARKQGAGHGAAGHSVATCMGSICAQPPRWRYRASPTCCMQGTWERSSADASPGPAQQACTLACCSTVAETSPTGCPVPRALGRSGVRGELVRALKELCLNEARKDLCAACAHSSSPPTVSPSWDPRTQHLSALGQTRPRTRRVASGASRRVRGEGLAGAGSRQRDPAARRGAVQGRAGETYCVNNRK